MNEDLDARWEVHAIQIPKTAPPWCSDSSYRCHRILNRQFVISEEEEAPFVEGSSK